MFLLLITFLKLFFFWFFSCEILKNVFGIIIMWRWWGGPGQHPGVGEEGEVGVVGRAWTSLARRGRVKERDINTEF